MVAESNKKRTAESAVKKQLHCTVKGCDYVTKESGFAAQELGRHMKFTHKIAGSSSSAKKAQALLAHAEIVAEKRTYKKRNPTNGKVTQDDARIFIFVGKITHEAEIEAEKLGISKESFTRRCAELFYASQIGS